MSDDEKIKDEEAFIKSMSLVLYATHKLNDANTIQGGVAQIDIMAYANPKAGSYRYVRGDTGEQVIVQPGERMYSSASMVADEYFDGTKWINMNDN